jgi:adenylate kinase
MSPGFSSLNLIFLGPPGAGKGTQARILAERYRIPHIATGDLLRDEVRRRTATGEQVEEIMAAGKLVPDPILNGLILPRLHHDGAARGFILDGYPRTAEQATLLDGILAELNRNLERVLLFTVTEQEVFRRARGRRVHPGSGRTYHLELEPPRHEGRDDESGEELVALPDDDDETVRRRLLLWREQTAPLAEIYRRRGLLVEVDGSRPVAEVAAGVAHVVTAPVGA